MKRKLIAIAVATALTTATSLISAQQGKMSDDVVKIGVLTDMSGVYADYGGPGACNRCKNGYRRLWRQDVWQKHRDCQCGPPKQT
jgi:hypothetical protein